HSCQLHPHSSSPATAPSPTQIYTLSLHDALPISIPRSINFAIGHGRFSSVSNTSSSAARSPPNKRVENQRKSGTPNNVRRARWADRKSTRLNSSHVKISYAVFCLKKKKKRKKND